MWEQDNDSRVVVVVVVVIVVVCDYGYKSHRINKQDATV